VEQRGEPKYVVGVWAVAATAAAIETILAKHFAIELHGMFKAHL
jgi:hypothetical protein